MDKDLAIKVEHVSMHFNLATEKVDNLKEYVIRMAKRQLFFRDFIALNDVSLEIKKGEVFGIVGTNGSGKSTLLKVISGILKPTKGTVETRGTIAPLIELGAGFDGDLTARENVYLNGAVLGYSKNFIDAHFHAIIDFAELWDFLDVPIKNYSSGMTARIAFAIATIIKPDILIVDEILSVGDFLFQQKCEKRIRELMDDGVTVVIVSHAIGVVEKLCTRVMWIEKSNVKMVGGTFEVCNAYRGLQNQAGNKAVQSLVTVCHEKCYLCGSFADFRVEQGVVLYREAVCSVCGSSIKNSDLVQLCLQQLGYQDKCLSELANELAEYRILNCANSGSIHSILKSKLGYYYYEPDQSVLCGGTQPIPYPDNHFDIIISDDLLSHTTDLPALLEEFYRVLKQDGTHVFTVPYHEARKTVFRHDLPNKVYRGAPILGDGVLVTIDWGTDCAAIQKPYGFSVETFKLHEFHKPDEITNIDDSFEACKNTHPYFYYKYNSVVFCARKAGN